MAVYTQISDSDLRDFFAQYRLGAVIGVQGIAEGTTNSNYKVETAEETVILTLYERRMEVAELPFFLTLMEHCAGKGVPCPAPVRGVDRKAWRMLAGKPAALTSYLYGKSVKKPSSVQVRSLGAALAGLHEATTDFGDRRTNALNLAGWQKLAAQCGSNLPDTAKSELSYLSAHWPLELPSGIIHADLFPDNVLFSGDSVAGLIDFYFACHDAYAYDLAICLNAWCFEDDVTFNVTKARALLAGYQSVRPLNDRELETLPVLCRGAALRFYLTRLYDWHHTPLGAVVKKRDPMSYWKRLAFHQQVQSAGEYGL
jgi:homoserine kinase type II